jgi:hypothetical protein
VPVFVVPFGRDQLEVARRVEVSDSGTRLPAKNLTPQRLRYAITEAMTKRPEPNGWPQAIWQPAGRPAEPTPSNSGFRLSQNTRFLGPVWDGHQPAKERSDEDGQKPGLGMVAPLLLLIATACGGDGAATTICDAKRSWS